MRTLPALVLTILALSLPALTAQTTSSPTKSSDSTTKPPSTQTEPKFPDKVTGRNLDEWIKRLHAHDPEVRRDAVRAMLLFGPAAGVAVPDIIHMIDQDRDISPRVNAIIVLMLLKDRDYVKSRDVKQAVLVLKRKVTDDYQAVIRLHAALALGSFGAEAKDAIPSLVRASSDRASAEIRKAAITALGKVAVDKKLKTPDPRASSAIADVLRQGATMPMEASAKVRLEGVMALGAMGMPTNTMIKNRVLGALIRRLNDPDKTVAVWAHVALMALENKVSEKYLKGIAAQLKHKDVEVRTNAARALGQLGGYANKEHIKLVKAHIPDLVVALKDSEPDVVSISCWALGQIGRNTGVGDKAQSALTNLSKGKDQVVKIMALAALESIKGKKDMKELKDIKKDIDKETNKDKKDKKPVLP